MRVEDVVAAAAMSEPKLKMVTVKRGDLLSYRLVPIARTDLDVLLDYIRFDRRPLIRRTCGAIKDDGFFFVSERTGRGLSAETITSEFRLMRNTAGVTQQACAHMLRHRRLTRHLIRLIRTHKLRNIDQFKAHFYDLKAFKHELMELTGRRSIASLDPYLHIAFDEVEKYSETISEARRQDRFDSAKANFERLRQRGGKKGKEYADNLERLIEAMLKDAAPVVRPDPDL